MEKMKEGRRNEIGYKMLLLKIKKGSRIRDLENIDREIGNLIKEPELREIEVTESELKQVIKEGLTEIFERLVD